MTIRDRRLVRASLSILAAAVGVAAAGATGPPPTELSDPLAPYVEFLTDGVQDPVDYVIGLFEDHDLVILCERWHPETTQYELFREVISDPRFAEQAGAVFTELGARNLQGDLDEIMATPDLDRAAVGRRLLPIFRDLGLHPFWDSTNFFEFLRGIYELNRGRPPERHVAVRLSDIPIDWSVMTTASYVRYREKTVANRDRLIAEKIIEDVRAMDREAGEPAKALVIMNYRHAFNDFAFADGSKGDNVGRYLFEAFPGRVANVMLNSVGLLPGTTDFEAVTQPIQEGRWDAAFRSAGVEEAGFDFAGSPFGRDSFDYFPFRPHDATYEDVFDGFVFYRPLPEHRLVSGIPGLFDDGFEAEARRRFAVVGRAVADTDFMEMVAAANEPMVESYDELSRYEAVIDRWLEPKPEPPLEQR